MSRCFRSASLLRSHLQVQSCGRGTTVGQTTADSCATRAECSLSTKFTLYLFNTMHLVDKGRSACPAAAWGVKRAGSRACCLSDLGCCLSDLLYGLRIARRCQPRRVHVFLVQRAPLWHALEDEMIDVRGFDYLPRQCSTARAGPVW